MAARKLSIAAFLLLLPLELSAATLRAEPGLCRAAVAAAERSSGVPDRLMHAISIIESGRRDPAGGVAAWPWTINVEGVGELFDTKQQAIAAVTAHRARGARSIDVGCMQINLKHHADAFTSLEEAFDPAANARYAATFLQRLLAQTGSWPRAVAGYHSLTPDLGDGYAKKVLAVWARPELPNVTPPQLALSPAAPRAMPIPSGSFPVASLPGGGMGAQILPLPGTGASTQTGRGLDSYRALPTRLMSVGLFRRQ